MSTSSTTPASTTNKFDDIIDQLPTQFPSNPNVPTKADFITHGIATWADLSDDTKRRQALHDMKTVPLAVAQHLYIRIQAEKKAEEDSKPKNSHDSGYSYGGGSRYTSRWSDDDLETYRKGYPNVQDNPAINDNYEFYANRGRSRPNHLLISDFHNTKKGQYHFLEIEHGYIQWLFPIQEHGMNWESVPLQKHEIEKMRADPAIIERIVLSYELILDFFGMKLDRATGEVARSAGYTSRYQNLDTSSHNYLRITRILKCLGEMGLEHYKKPWLKFFIKEVYEHKELTNTANSLERYWIGTLRNDTERAEVKKYHDDMKAKHPLPVKQYGYSKYW
eukprot:PhF_6_TR37813/c0_g1_i1/m.56299